MNKNIIRKTNKQKGFSLPELIIVIAIFVIISSVAMFNQGKLSSSVLLTNMAYEVGLAVREAQTYGIGVQSVDPSGNNFTSQYGVRFSIEDETSKRQVVVFADQGATADSTYTPGEEKYIYEFSNRRGNKIEAICVGTLPTGTACTATTPTDAGAGTGSFSSVDILFKRPNPAAVVYSSQFSNPLPKTDRVYIVISSLTGDDCRAIIVEPTGQVRVEDSNKGSCVETP